MVRILHISDLHHDHEETDYSSLFRAIAHALDQQRPVDIVCLTGDLVNAPPRRQVRRKGARRRRAKSAADEYGDLASAIKEMLPHVLSNADQQQSKLLERLIVVPGNHDIDWTIEAFREVPMPDFRGEDKAHQQYLASCRDAMRHPETSKYRLHITPHGVRVLQVDEKRYADRFRAFGAFYRDLYKGVRVGKHSEGEMQLMDLSKPGKDWSIHEFVDLGVAVVGLNSCAVNDKYNKLGLMHKDAVHGAAKRLSQSNPDYLRIVLWHHGPFPQIGERDAIDQRHVSELVMAGMHIGLHGHTHGDSVVAHKEPGSDRHAYVVGSGTLGAAHGERDDGQLNQFSVITLDKRGFSQERYERRGKAKGFVAVTERSPFYSFLGDQRTADRTYARLHRRDWHIDSLGRVTGRVTMEDVSHPRNSPVVLLRDIRTVGSTYAPDRQVYGPGAVSLGDVDINMGENRVAVLWKPNTETTSRLDWTFVAGNAVALGNDETALYPLGVRGPEWPCVWHVLVHECEDLFLQYGMRASASPPTPPRCAEYAPCNDPQEWAATGRRGVPTRTSSGWQWQIARPQVGFLYALEVLFPTDVRKLGAAIKPPHWIRQLVDQAQLRESHPRSATVDLERDIRKHLEGFRVDLSHREWHVYAWNGSAAYPICGSFKHKRQWGRKIRWGTDVVGHALRLGIPVLWFDKIQHARMKVLLEPDEDDVQPSVMWSLPIRDPSGACVAALTLRGDKLSDDLGRVAEAAVAKVGGGVEWTKDGVEGFRQLAETITTGLAAILHARVISTSSQSTPEQKKLGGESGTQQDRHVSEG